VLLIIKGQGKRSDLSESIRVLEKTKSVKRAALSHPETFVKYHNGLKALHRIMLAPRKRSDPVLSVWLKGPTGIGKTTGICQLLESKGVPEDWYYIWSPKSTGMWFEGYEGQRIIILDELSAKAPIQTLLRLMQPLPMEIAIHNNTVPCCASVIFVTTNVSMETMFLGVPEEQVDALKRRVTAPFGYTLEADVAQEIKALPYAERTGRMADVLEMAVEEHDAWINLLAEVALVED